MKKMIPLFAAGLVLLLTAGSSLAAGRPNILFIIADDQSPFDLRIYDSKSSLDTPNIDRLAAGGMVFDAAYHMGSVFNRGGYDTMRTCKHGNSYEAANKKFTVRHDDPYRFSNQPDDGLKPPDLRNLP